jgi:catechol 2,3-dioxygenase-like lactoylglutathione lyase family enzyme
MNVTGVDHYVLTVPDVEKVVAWYRDELGLQPERLEEWRRGEVLFASLRITPTTLIDVFEGERGGVNVDHVALVVDDVDLDELAESGRFEVEMGPADLWGARGTGRGLYIKDPAGNRVELRTY